MKEKQNIGEIDWNLVGKYFSGEATPQEAKEVEEWSDQSEENRAEFKRIRKLLEESESYYQRKKFDTDAAWKRLRSKTLSTKTETARIKPEHRTAFDRFYKYAAAIVVAVTLGVAAYYIGFRDVSDTHFEQVVSAEKQVVKEFVLPDGSVVALNSNSKLVFPEKFTDNLREVTVVGEAFFDVQPNPEKPFIIHAGNARVEVLGTSFNVRAYPENEAVEVVVETGKVQVSRENNGRGETNGGLTLAPGEKGLVYSENKPSEKSINGDKNILAWKTQNLVFSKTPLIDVVNNLERVYHVKVRLNEEKLNDLPLTATFNKKPIEFVLNVIQLTFDLELTSEDDLFILSSHKNEQVKL